jgi:hypothetical protein
MSHELDERSPADVLAAKRGNGGVARHTDTVSTDRAREWLDDTQEKAGTRAWGRWCKRVVHLPLPEAERTPDKQAVCGRPHKDNWDSWQLRDYDTQLAMGASTCQMCRFHLRQRLEQDDNDNNNGDTNNDTRT